VNWRTDLPGEASEMFLREGLDDPNQFEIAAQIEVYAQRIFRAFVIGRRGMRTDFASSGKSALCGYCGHQNRKL
jgi:hypothetical protein